MKMTKSKGFSRASNAYFLSKKRGGVSQGLSHRINVGGSWTKSRNGEKTKIDEIRPRSRASPGNGPPHLETKYQKLKQNQFQVPSPRSEGMNHVIGWGGVYLVAQLY